MQEDDGPCIVDGQDNSKHVVVFDPLDGSSNIAASIPTGTIVGVGGCKLSWMPVRSSLALMDRVLFVCLHAPRGHGCMAVPMVFIIDQYRRTDR